MKKIIFRVEIKSELLRFSHLYIRTMTANVLTEPRRALQPKGTQWFLRIELFLVQAISLGPWSLQKNCLYFHEKLQRNPSVRRGIFRPYGFENLGFLKNVCRGAMRSKTHWVFYRDLDWWPGPQKVQFGEITGYP